MFYRAFRNQTCKSISELGAYSSPMTKLAGVVASAGLTLLGAIAVRAERELTPLVGSQEGGGLDTRDGTLTVYPGFNLGLLSSLRTRHDGLVEFLYSRQVTSLVADGPNLSGDLPD